MCNPMSSSVLGFLTENFAQQFDFVFLTIPETTFFKILGTNPNEIILGMKKLPEMIASQVPNEMLFKMFWRCPVIAEKS